MIYPQPAIERFWQCVAKDKDGCWEWTGVLTCYGYGEFKAKKYGIRERTHRMVYQMLNDVILPKDLFVCHHCDNRKCVRPDHLFVGTVQDNTQDMIQKGRMVIPRGQQRGHAKLRDADVVRILDMRDSGMTYREIAEYFPVHEHTIGSIARREKWTHVLWARTHQNRPRSAMGKARNER